MKGDFIMLNEILNVAGMSDVVVSVNFAGCRSLSEYINDYVQNDLFRSGIEAHYASAIRNLSKCISDIRDEYERQLKVFPDMPMYQDAMHKSYGKKLSSLEHELTVILENKANALSKFDAEGWKKSKNDTAFIKAWNNAVTDEDYENALCKWADFYGLKLACTDMLVELMEATAGDKKIRKGTKILANAEAGNYKVFTRRRSGGEILGVMLATYANRLYALGFIDPEIPRELSAEYDYLVQLRADRQAKKAAKKAARAKKYGKKSSK